MASSSYVPSSNPMEYMQANMDKVERFYMSEVLEACSQIREGLYLGNQGAAGIFSDTRIPPRCDKKHSQSCVLWV